ncbi:hypothetical protein QBC37DRAFT_391785 [Rhypophila decipiens]|uniref:C2H2-type domain-containing protein n=1 Tax=Rhypophila decipiens TaxID=261697 RepID=A0AAN7B3L7_9PEZI|nr:hypothetical protein QBC37DRAFT_391785 [Rhypophila decipiens]
MSDIIREEGINVVYAPNGGLATVDILLVHGLQGHPYKTWACSRPKKECIPGKSGPTHDEDSSRNPKGWQKVLPRRAKEKSHEDSFPGDLPAEAMSAEYELDPNSSSIYWPKDLLPHDCKNARIIVYGYDTRVTKYLKGSTSKNTVFSHGKDLVFSLSRARPRKRPLIVVAHSLGGIVVKEMLARSASSSDAETHDIVESVASIIFLGTPHRGSPELAAMGELARSLVSALRMETTSTILDALGLRTTDLERAQESFSLLLHEYGFKVKTFQEGMGLTGINLGVLGNKVVPDHSSLIGDHRERAETIHANHMNMCRFWGASDPNYGRVAGEIHSVYQSITELSSSHRRPDSLSQAPLLKRKRGTTVSDSVESIPGSQAFIQSLRYPSMDSRRQDIDGPAEGTCHWLFEHRLYQGWLHGTNRENGHGLLRLRGKPGTGKSILMKEAFRRALQAEAESDCLAAAFFFGARGDPLDRDPVGMYRSLLYQLLPKVFQSRHTSRSSIRRLITTVQLPDPVWTKSTLKDKFERALDLWPSKLLLFLDGLDACGDKDARELAFQMWELTNSVRKKGCVLHICISTRHFPTITIADCPDIIVDDHNNGDLALYMDRRFRFAVAVEGPEWRRLTEIILEKSGSVFLWVVLVVDEMIRQSDEGHDIGFLLKHVDVLPAELEALYANTMSSIPPETRCLALRLFTWAVLAQKPLRLHEWHHILAFIKEPAPVSLTAWRASDTFTRNDDQLEKQIRSISRGLVEVKRPHVIAEHGHDLDVQSVSMCAGAGSLNLDYGESRIVQVIHESVRGFFLEHAGFSHLGNTAHNWNGHIFIMETCLKYIGIHELDALVQARNVAALKVLNDASNDSRQHQPTQSQADGTPQQLLNHDTNKDNCDNQISNHERFLYVYPECPGAVGMGTASAETPTFRMLRESSGPVIGIDITLWITGVLDFMVSTMDVDESFPKSPTQLSVVGQARVLEDHPALLSYVTSELFTHAWLAYRCGADPLKLFDGVYGTHSWHRWVALREDIPLEVSLRSYAAIFGVLDDSLELEASDEPHHTAFDDYVSHEREGSVASFGSAGTHMSHTMPSPIWPASRNNLFEEHPFTFDDADMVLHGPEAGLKAPETGLFSPIPGSPGVDSGGYTCTYHGCAEHFETPAMLQKHKSEGHRAGHLAAASETDQNTSTRYPAGGPYRCDRTNPSTGKPCSVVFSRPHDLTRHEDTIHNARKQKLRCDLCTDDKTFNRPDALTRHYRVCHPDVDLPGKRRRVDLAFGAQNASLASSTLMGAKPVITSGSSPESGLPYTIAWANA